MPEVARRVFHLTSVENAEMILGQRRLKVSRIDDLNDPFEWLALHVEDKKHRAALNKWRVYSNDNHGVLSVSQDWRNPVLWSHYGDRRRGMALGFDIPERFAMEINYEKERVICRPASDGTWPRDAVSKVHCTKFEHWSYEEEVRMIFDLRETTFENSLYFASFGPELRLREVVIGPRCAVGVDWIKNVAGGRKLGADLIQSRLALHSYAVVRDKRRKVRSI